MYRSPSNDRTCHLEQLRHRDLQAEDGGLLPVSLRGAGWLEVRQVDVAPKLDRLSREGRDDASHRRQLLGDPMMTRDEEMDAMTIRLRSMLTELDRVAQQNRFAHDRWMVIAKLCSAVCLVASVFVILFTWSAGSGACH
jgi:hypothetical protein